jgi:hypothetical protein
VAVDVKPDNADRVAARADAQVQLGMIGVDMFLLQKNWSRARRRLFQAKFVLQGAQSGSAVHQFLWKDALTTRLGFLASLFAQAFGFANQVHFSVETASVVFGPLAKPVFQFRREAEVRLWICSCHFSLLMDHGGSHYKPP